VDGGDLYGLPGCHVQKKPRLRVALACFGRGDYTGCRKFRY
jgi:hypothetical protein